MKRPSEPPEDWESLRKKVIGLGERSLRKSYYPELQRQLEATLQSEERFRLLAENTHDGVLIIEDDVINYANPRLVEILGDSWADLSGDLVASTLLREISAERMDHGHTKAAEFWIVRSDGHRRYLHVRYFRLRLDEHVDRLYVMLTDMTAHKLREEELERRVRERTLELQKANEKLKELDQLKNNFISNVSHDLRTPLTNIQLFSQLLEMNKKPEKQASYWQVLHTESARLETLIEDLLTLAKLEHGRFPQKLKDTNIHQLLTQELTAFQARIKSKRLFVTQDHPHDLPLIRLDRRRIRQVFNNLLSNAIAYAPKKGNIRILYTAVTLQNAPAICVKIQNDGSPIAAKDLPYLFERFYRGENARATKEHGTGLGLAICKEIVEQHNGIITVESNENEGTSVTVYLPIAQELP